MWPAQHKQANSFAGIARHSASPAFACVYNQAAEPSCKIDVTASRSGLSHTPRGTEAMEGTHAPAAKHREGSCKSMRDL